MKMKIYHLEHEYAWLNDKNEEIDEVKYIGTFSSKQKALEAIEQLKEKKGFVNYPIDCFKIHESYIDTFE
jgi:hypothetical protein